MVCFVAFDVLDAGLVKYAVLSVGDHGIMKMQFCVLFDLQRSTTEGLFQSSLNHFGLVVGPIRNPQNSQELEENTNGKKWNILRNRPHKSMWGIIEVLCPHSTFFMWRVDPGSFREFRP